MQDSVAAIPIIIVGFRNSGDILDALEALRLCQSSPAFTVYVCENGGESAFRSLIEELSSPSSPVEPDPAITPLVDAGFPALLGFRLRTSGVEVFVGDARENLGYAGGVNRWLRPLLAAAWPGVFILNPDAAPAPDALAVLRDYADANAKGMVTGRIVLADRPDLIQMRGLRWLRWRAITQAVDRLAPSSVQPDVIAVEQKIDAPLGAALYVRRECIDRIGLMREDYFLYFEDLDWGIRAKRSCGLGYAYEAVIVHKAGTTIGTGTASQGSPFAAYMDFRNTMLFVREHMPSWFGYILIVRLIRVFRLLVIGRPDKAGSAIRGLWDGVCGRSGRPEHMLALHRSKR